MLSARLPRNPVSNEKVSALMADATVRLTASTARTGRRVLVFAVLLGLFLMHGMSASADAACAAPTSAQITAGSVGQSATPMQAADEGVSAAAAKIASDEHCACDHAMASCTPLAGRDHGVLLGALLLTLAATPALRSGSARSAPARAPRPDPRRRAAAVLDLACVSRT